MYCSRCGKENNEAATLCSACGHLLSNRPVADHEGANQLPRSDQELKKLSVIVIILLTLITAGIYFPIWFLKRRSAINNLNAKEKIESGLLKFVIGLLGIGLLLTLISSITEELGEPVITSGLNRLSGMLNLIAGVILWVQCFKVRRIFQDHFNVHLKKDISFSAVATFFLTIYYLQYKINRL